MPGQDAAMLQDMSPLLKIRAERDRMSAIERRIGDFLLDNAHLLRDYSSQQLASALGISQSSVVKFSQKLGFKGYPDLKFSIGEALARADAGPGVPHPAPPAQPPHMALGDALWRGKARAREETSVVNPVERIDAVVQAIAGADRVFLCGMGQDGLHARSFGLRLALHGIATVAHSDPLSMAASVHTAHPRDVLVAFSEHGRQSDLCHLSRRFRERRGYIVSITRHSANPLRAHADTPLLVCAHDEEGLVESLIYQAALEHLLDMTLLLLCRRSGHLSVDERDRIGQTPHAADP
nr:MurR/RpiR family transcriptional regulator [Lysobacter penaei]